MSMINTATLKQPYKLIEIPLSKFEEEAIPHHVKLFETHKNAVEKFASNSNIEQLDREIKSNKRVVRQLKDLMYELDTLRTQVDDSDLDRFDSQTLSLRKTILTLINNYAVIDAESRKLILNVGKEYRTDNPTYGAPQLQIQESYDLKPCENRLDRVEALNRDIEDVHEIFIDLNQLVGQQKELVMEVEANVEVASENVESGLQQLIKASRLKKASYPVAGALIGTVVGGPIGALAGLKVGGIAAIGCGLVGYFSGRFMKKTGEVLPTIVEFNEENVDSTQVTKEKVI